AHAPIGTVARAPIVTVTTSAAGPAGRHQNRQRSDDSASTHHGRTSCHCPPRRSLEHISGSVGEKVARRLAPPRSARNLATLSSVRGRGQWGSMYASHTRE